MMSTIDKDSNNDDDDDMEDWHICFCQKKDNNENCLHCLNLISTRLCMLYVY